MPIFGNSGGELVLGDRDPHTPYRNLHMVFYRKGKP